MRLHAPLLSSWLGIVLQGRPAAALESEARRRIYDLILANPGLAMSALSRRAQLQWGAIHFHVLRLEAAGLVRTYRVGRRRLVFATAELDGAEEERGVLIEPACRRVALAILEHPGRDVLQLVDLTKLTPRVVYHHARRLVDLGLVTTAAAGHYRGLRASARLYALLLDEG